MLKKKQTTRNGSDISSLLTKNERLVATARPSLMMAVVHGGQIGLVALAVAAALFSVPSVPPLVERVIQMFFGDRMDAQGMLSTARGVAVMCVAGSIAWGLGMAMWNRAFNIIVLTDKRIFSKRGFFMVETEGLSLGKIETANEERPMMGNLLGWMHIWVTGTGGSLVGLGGADHEEATFLMEKLEELRPDKDSQS